MIYYTHWVTPDQKIFAEGYLSTLALAVQPLMELFYKQKDKDGIQFRMLDDETPDFHQCYWYTCSHPEHMLSASRLRWEATCFNALKNPYPSLNSGGL